MSKEDKLRDMVERIQRSVLIDLTGPVELSDDVQTCGRPAFKPDLEDKTLVMGEGWHKLRVGDRVWLERTNLFWSDTCLCEVMRIDEETGDVDLWNLAKKHHNFTNFKTAHARGHRVRVGTPIKKKRVVVTPAGDTSVPLLITDDEGEKPKRGRGRPKGSKNRPREVIRAERAQQRAVKAEKKRLKREKK